MFQRRMFQRRKSWVWAVALVGFALTAQPAVASVILDQSQDTAGGVFFMGQSEYAAQTFTVGVAGVLDHINVRLRGPFSGAQGGPPDYNLLISLQGLSGGLPDGTDLASDTITPGEITPADTDSSGGYVTFDVSVAAINVLVGDMFAFVVHGEGSGSSKDWNVMLADGNPYSGGTLLTGPPGSWIDYPDYDWRFETFVDTSGGSGAVPEPGSLALLGLGVLGLGALDRRRRKAR